MLRKALCSFSVLKHLSPYQILNVDQTATQEEIKAKYYELAQKYHPDHDPSFTQKFKSINQAYQILKNVQKRRQLDGFMAKGVNSLNYSDYSSTRYSYGHGHQARKSQYENEIKKRFVNQQQKTYSYYQPQNNYFDFGLKSKSTSSGQEKYVRMRQQQNLIKMVITGTVVLVALFGVVELVFKVYEFNNKGHKNDASVLAAQKKNNIL